MMQKRTLYSLLLISFIVVFSVSASFANQVTVQSKNSLRCDRGVLDVTAVVSADSVSAVEIVLEVTGAGGAFFDSLTFQWAAGFTALDDRVIDLSRVNHVSPDTIRIAAMRLNPTDASLKTGSTVVGQIKFKTSNNCGGTVGIAGGTFEYSTACGCPLGPITTQFVSAKDASILPVAVTPGTVTVVNNAPVLAAIPNATIHWGDLYTGSAHATDPDTANGCETVSYSKLSGPAALTVNATTGAISYLAPKADICVQNVKIVASDLCGAKDTVSFDICVQNTPPVVTCPANQSIFAGETLTVNPTAVDPDGGPNSLIWSLVSTTAPGTVNVNPVTGQITWATLVQANYTGTFTICVMASDGAPVCTPCSPANADTCCFNVTVTANSISIQKVHNQIQGQFTFVDISMLDETFLKNPMGGFDFLFAYDASALSLSEVLPGQFISDCGWEYFTYRFGPFGNCGNGCPSGLVRVVAMAETNNGANHPDCFTTSPATPGSEVLARLKFYVSANATYECQYVPVKWYWLDCGDNGISNVAGDTLFLSKNVFDYYGNNGVDSWVSVYDPSFGFPSYYGAATECNVFTQKGHPVRAIDFYNGGVDIVCADSIDARGDINLNGLAYEISDAVMFTQYFIKGLSAFPQAGQGVQGAIAASDVNADGITLSVADLVYLIRVVVGDAAPYDKVNLDAVKAKYSTDGNVLTINDVTVGAIAMVVSGKTEPKQLISGVTMDYAYDEVANVTKIVVVPTYVANSHVLNGFSGDILEVSGNVVSIEGATITGQPLALVSVPKSFSLSQNYPNPFNPTTTIQFALPTAGDYSLTIYNVQGQAVKTFDGTASDAGYFSVEWDASNVASGVYFYKLTSGSFSNVKKMMLVK